MIKPSELLARIGLVLGSLVVAAAVLVLAELIVRTTTDVGRLGNSAGLFTKNAYGPSVGNAPNAMAMSFGVQVSTDEHGFRARAAGPAKSSSAQKALLILGDSVGFGVGVPFDATVAARLGEARPQTRIYNASVIGYGVDDYRNVADTFPATISESLTGVIVVFCLNDISTVNAAEIRARHRVTTDQRSTDQLRRAGFGLPPDLVESLRQGSLARSVNDYLRIRSSLFVLLRGVATNPRARYWQEMLQTYTQTTTAELDEILAPLNELSATFRNNAVPTTVFLMPFAEQMIDGRSGLPQQKLTAYFRRQGITYVDTEPLFRAADDPQGRFLPFDPMHLSTSGHELLFEIISEFSADPH